MIERLVLVKLIDDLTHADGRAEVAAHTRTALEAIPGVRSVRVGVPADEASAGSWDISIAVGFDAVEAIEPYRVHPAHRAFVDDYLAPRMTFIKAWNFEVDDA